MKLARAAASPRDWSRFARRYRAEMAAPGPRHCLDLLAALSHTTDFSVGCYCEREERCHRSLLGQLLADRGARMTG
jgi:uncharacterized protein YeaO (DUF488 family)